MDPFRSKARKTKMNYDVIPPERALRRTDRKHFGPAATGVEDAEFEVLRPGPRPQRHPVFNDNRKPASPKRHAANRNFGLDTAGGTLKSSVRALARIPRRGLAGLAAFLLVTVGLAVYFGPGAFAGGTGGLVITDIRQSPIDSNGLRIVELTGNVENHSRHTMALPALVAEMKSDTGTINQSAISLGDRLLAAGETARFTVRLPSPGGKRQEVSVSFAAKGV